jgi:hypothetical protein
MTGKIRETFQQGLTDLLLGKENKYAQNQYGIQRKQGILPLIVVTAKDTRNEMQ